MRKIKISEQTYAQLQARARPFEDTTPESVIVRLLQQSGGATQNRDGALAPTPTEARAAPGTILPEREYWRPLLQVLADRGGGAPAQEVIDGVGDLLAERLTPRDHEPLRTGEIRWRKRTQFARFRMKERGLLADSSDRGIWEITDAGRAYLRQE